MNWGHKLTIAFIAFAAMMIFLVGRAFKTDFELVEKEYYNKELKYQDVIDGKKLAATLSKAPEFRQTSDTLFLQMPDELKGKKNTGRIWFYCSYAAANDKRFSLDTDNAGKQIFTGIKTGVYIAKLEWTSEMKTYYFEKEIRLN